MKKWQYKTIRFYTTLDLEESLEQTSDDWELIQVLDHDTFWIAIFKRQVDEINQNL